MSTRWGAGLWVVTVLSVIIIFFNLGGIPLLDPDEPVYAETPKEMLEFNEFISPRIYGEYWYDKPPMYYWLVAAAFKVFGINEFAARFPSAILAICGILAVYFSCSRLFSIRAGVASALILATSIEYFYLGKAAVTDITLTLFLTAALLSFIEKRYYLFYIFAGLATVAKGPVGLLFPGAIVFLYLLVTRNFDELRKMKIPAGIVLYSVVALPWYVAMYKIHGMAFIETFLGFHNITRFTTPEHPEVVRWYYYIPVLALGFFPWTAIMGQAVWKSLTEGGRDSLVLVFLNIWAVFIFLFFSISQTKLVSYILPMFPPLAMIVGWHFDRLWDWKYNVRGIGWPIILTALAVAFIAGMFIGLKTMPELKTGVIAASGVLILMAATVWYFVWRKEHERAFVAQVASMIAFSMILVTLLFPVAAPNFTSKHMAKEFLARYDGKSPVYIIKFLHPGFTFYTNMYGIEVKSHKELPRVIDESGRSSYFVIQQLDYKRISESDRQKLTVEATVADKLLLIKK